jgi:outer membrane protein assembly factor BamE (lipoprotein component of BamABCDE complex)
MMIGMSKLLRFFCLAGFLILTGCGSMIADCNKIENGMTESQVRQILGSPVSTEAADGIGVSMITYLYQKGDSEAKIVFVNGRVQSKSVSFK